MGEVDLRAAASRISCGPSSSPWEALAGLSSVLKQTEEGLMAVSAAEGDGLVESGTFEKVGQDIVAAVSGSRASLAAVSREIDRILQSAAATARAKGLNTSRGQNMTYKGGA